MRTSGLNISSQRTAAPTSSSRPHAAATPSLTCKPRGSIQAHSMSGKRPVRPTRKAPQAPIDYDQEDEGDFLIDVEDLAIIDNIDTTSDLPLFPSDSVSLSSDDSTLMELTPLDQQQEEDNPYTIDDALRAPVDIAIGEPELEALLAEGGRDLSVDRIVRLFPFPLDGFQKRALEKLVEGKSVVVCAPTGAGKTAIAEAASAATLARGQRVIYTTPLKALSNQKLAEVKKRFGADRCGLQTGDTSLNTEVRPQPLPCLLTQSIPALLARPCF